MALRPEDAQARSELLLRDAEEDLRRERLQALWREWGATLIGMALMLVIGTGAGVAWRHWSQTRNETSTARLLHVFENPEEPMTPEVARGMKADHAAIAWLSRVPNAKPEDLPALYSAAANAGGGKVWGWLARWNELRLRMDDPKEDPARLIADYRNLAGDMKHESLSALAWTDAAIIAGERQKDPQAALGYLASAEKVTPRATPMSAVVTDLKHLYVVRSQAAQGGTP
jgi:hypothetical protein